MLVAIDQTTSFALTRLHQIAKVKVATNVLPALVHVVRCRIHTALPDNALSSAMPCGMSPLRGHVQGVVCRTRAFQRDPEHLVAALNPWRTASNKGDNRST